MKKIVSLLVIVVAALAVTLFANTGSGCCSIPQKGTPATANASADRVTRLHVDGMTCGACATALKQVLKKTDGVKDARVSYEEKSAVVTYDATKVTPEKIVRAISEKLPTYKATVVK